ncbi:MAG: hypothetical protein K6B65_01010 [Bacilli bacterium]|nr:hypothetical protein [Bacilli bacterium]
MFIETVIETNNPQHYGSCYFLYEHDSSNLDQDFTVAKAIKDSAPFSKTMKKDDTPKRFFTYQAYWTPATSGPNYCTLSLFEDGYIVIDHKKSLGPNGYLYFNMDEAKAKSVVDLAFERAQTETSDDSSI